MLSMGYNGVPRNFPHCTDTPCPGKNGESGDTQACYAVHAEANALLQCPRLDLADTMYCSCTPCFECAKLIGNTSIRRVLANEQYADLRGTELLLALSIKVSIGKGF